LSGVGSSGMKLYAVRKRRGQWSVYADEEVFVEFDSYDEAIRTAQGAADVLSNRAPQVDEVAAITASYEVPRRRPSELAGSA
jgi:hypothetical protein